MHTKTQYRSYEVKEKSLADWALLGCILVEAKMPGLVLHREEFSESKFFAGDCFRVCHSAAKEEVKVIFGCCNPNYNSILAEFSFDYYKIAMCKNIAEKV